MSLSIDYNVGRELTLIRQSLVTLNKLIVLALDGEGVGEDPNLEELKKEILNTESWGRVMDPKESP